MVHELGGKKCAYNPVIDVVTYSESCAASVHSREAHQVSLRDSQLATSGSKPHWHYYEDLGGLYTQRGVM